MRSGTVIVLLILVAVPYVTGLNYGFIYDDHGSIEDNPFLFSPGSLGMVLTLRTVTDSTISDGRRPMVILSYFMDRAFWKLQPFGYHLTNLLLHLLVVFLLLLFVRRLGEAAPGAGGGATYLPFAAALLFGFHPVLTEAVQVPSFREDLLFGAFMLGYLLAGTSRRPVHWLTLPLLFLALLSKESAAVAPLLLLWVWMCFPEARPAPRTAAALVALGLAVSAAFVIVWATSGSLQAASAEWAGLGLGFPANLFTAPWLWVKALRVVAWPHPLIADYVADPVTSMRSARFAAGVAAAAFWAGAALLLRRRARWVGLGMGWMLIAFVPVANLIPLYNPFAERYLYFITAGFAVALASLLRRLPAAPGKPLRNLPAVALAVICAVYAGRSVARLRDWSDDYTLWSKTLAQEPRSARAHTWTGLELKKRGDLEGAYRRFVEADKLYPADISALINIAILYGEQGRLAEAEQLLREAVSRRPNKPDAHWNLAVALYKQDKKDEARAEIERALELDPRHQPALGGMLEMMGVLQRGPATPTIDFEEGVPAPTGSAWRAAVEQG